MNADFLLQLLLQVWLPIALLVMAGGLWVRFRPQFPADPLRVNLNRLVIDVFAPPLLFALSAQAEISHEMLTVPLLTLAGIAISFALLYPLLWHSRIGRDLASWLAAAEPEHPGKSGGRPAFEIPGGVVGTSGAHDDTDGDGDSDAPGESD